MKLEKAIKRDKNRSKKNKMVVTGKSVFTILNILIKRGSKKENKNGK